MLPIVLIPIARHTRQIAEYCLAMVTFHQLIHLN